MNNQLFYQSKSNLFVYKKKDLCIFIVILTCLIYLQILPSLFISRHVLNNQRKREKRCKICPLTEKITKKSKEIEVHGNYLIFLFNIISIYEHTSNNNNNNMSHVAHEACGVDVFLCFNPQSIQCSTVATIIKQRCSM